MKSYDLTYRPMGERAILIEWPGEIDEAVLEDVIRFRKMIRKAFRDECELVPAYHTLLVIFPEKIQVGDMTERFRKLYSNRKNKPLKRRLWKFPVCYDKEFGLDLELLSSEKSMPEDELITLHTGKVYTVFAIGFLPGFMYLGGLDERLFSPRKSDPRLKVARGAVGIGGKQTGIYPQESPGGWNIIGNSPVKLFDPYAKKPCKIKIGDKVQFYRVKKAEHELISIEAAAGVYKIEKENWHD
ncbi:5-oxoprolinase subunit PxpB [Sinomicrobium weinanense]|uniref:5-oxoprolinase subunit PxpB n=1 Tax=Sinomicrobium weinanense TaxID=2842200 RepID=A0A926JRU1_9FLAO|nr:5-oxoprolinase subunit PxpB [Sinomicrobium weinanense]MBC9796337.1 5-oxoprolinase subunit PxpB [Sinomicrobium weinanense]MBU3122461.1 5-oxoprolinase subunit PxpB [Sinomicrobium weinanense]